MTDVNTIGVVIAVLTLLFSVEDLIGTRNQARLEAAWLNASNRLFRSWQTAVRNSTRWWLALLSSAGAFLLAGSIYAGFLYAATLVREHWAVGGSPLWVALGLLAAGGLILRPALWFLGTVLDWFISTPAEVVDPIEVRWAHWLLHYPKMPQGGGDSPAAPFILMFTPLFFILVGALLAPLALVVIFSRVFAYASLLLLWVPLLGPARLLHAIGRRTGADSYLKAGKYLLSVLATGLAIYLFFR